MKDILSDKSDMDNFKYKPPPHFYDKNRNGEDTKFEDDDKYFDLSLM